MTIGHASTSAVSLQGVPRNTGVVHCGSKGCTRDTLFTICRSIGGRTTTDSCREGTGTTFVVATMQARTSQTKRQAERLTDTIVYEQSCKHINYIFNKTKHRCNYSIHMHVDTIVGRVQLHTCICVHIPTIMAKCMLRYMSQLTAHTEHNCFTIINQAEHVHYHSTCCLLALCLYNPGELSSHCSIITLMDFWCPCTSRAASSLQLQVGVPPLHSLLAMQVRLLSPCRVYPLLYMSIMEHMLAKQLTIASRCPSAPMTIGHASTSAFSLQSVPWVTGVGHCGPKG